MGSFLLELVVFLVDDRRFLLKDVILVGLLTKVVLFPILVALGFDGNAPTGC